MKTFLTRLQGMALALLAHSSVSLAAGAGNDPPTLDPISSPAAILEDAGWQTVILSGITAGAEVWQTLEVTATSSNTSLIPHPNVVYTSPSSSGEVLFKPVANLSGAATITVTVNDRQANNSTFSRSFTVTVNEVNDPPTLSLPISFVPAAPIPEDSGMQTLSLLGISAGPFESQELVVTAISSNPALIPHPTVNYTSPNDTGSLSFTPVPNASGSAVIYVTVNDQQATMNTVTRNHVVTVSDSTDPPFGTDKTLTLLAGSTHTFTTSDWGLSDPFDNPANALSAVVLSSLPNSGLLRINGDAASSGQGAYLGWTPRGSSQSWRAIASSADGSRLAAVASGGQIHVSSDYGVTWIARESNRFWSSIASSADGSRLIAVEEDGQIYVSSDYGVSWEARETNRSWKSVASSADGQRLVAAGSGTQIHVSDNYGASWTTAFANRPWASIACSADGIHIFATEFETIFPTPPATRIQVRGGFYHSSNFGVNWTGVNESRMWTLIASSADGGNLVAAIDPGLLVTNPGHTLYTSTDSGQTWTERRTRTSWSALATSATGTKIFAASGRIHISNDQGNTWTEHESSRHWRGITSSADGSRVAATVSGGQIYTFGGPPPVVTYEAPATTGSSSFTFQVQDEGDTANLDLTPNTMTINVVSQPDFWRQTHFGSTSNSGNGGDLADPDDDGIPNLLEYALGLHPGQNSAGQMPQAVRSGGDLVYTFTEPAGVTGITYSAEWSETLQTASWTSAGITHTVNNRVHTFTLPVGASPGAFIRLRVTTP